MILHQIPGMKEVPLFGGSTIVALGGSISIWIEGVKAGCESAATNLWVRYRKRLLGVARRKLKGASRSVQDEEDIALTAFHSFLIRSRDGRFPFVKDRDDLSRLLITITVRKALNEVRVQRCVKRNPILTALAPHADTATAASWGDLVSGEVSAEINANVMDSLNQLLSSLDDGELRSIVIYKLEGYSNAQLAAKIGRSVPTIERRLRLIREIWREEVDK